MLTSRGGMSSVSLSSLVQESSTVTPLAALDDAPGAATATLLREPTGPGAGATAAEAADDAVTRSAMSRAVASACSPASPPGTYKLIFKNGDDLRQDQLIIQASLSEFFCSKFGEGLTLLCSVCAAHPFDGRSGEGWGG
jgi:hypothetical protein